ncbi:hypothetical protein GMSM_22620 [Geomonas sp. Red276]
MVAGGEPEMTGAGAVEATSIRAGVWAPGLESSEEPAAPGEADERSKAKSRAPTSAILPVDLMAFPLLATEMGFADHAGCTTEDGFHRDPGM